MPPETKACYSVKAVSELTGLSPILLRAWERRYQAVVPKRLENGRRAYTQADVNRLQQLSQLVENGHSISRIANLNPEELSSLSSQVTAEQQTQSNNTIPSRFNGELLRTVEQLDFDGCERILGQAVTVMPVLELVEGLLMPTLTEVGNRWHTGEFDIAHERTLTVCVQKLLIALLNNQHGTSGRPIFVFGNLSGERHEFGTLCAALIAAQHGIDCKYIGPDIPAQELAKIATSVNASAVILSSVYSKEESNFAEQLRELTNALPPSIEVLIGGHGALHRSLETLPHHVKRIESFTDFQNRIAGWS